MARSENSHAAICMVASMAGFGLNDAFIKLVGQDLPLFQAVFLRGLMATFLIGILAARDGGARFRPSRSDRRLISLRTAAEIGATVCFLTALFHMPIANASAIVQSVPLAVTLAAAAFMGEPVGWRRYVAIGVGFAGVLVIARPGTDGFNVYALWALASVGCIVLRDTRGRGIMLTLDGRLGRVQVDNVESVAAASVQRPAKLELKEGESALSAALGGAK